MSGEWGEISYHGYVASWYAVSEIADRFTRGGEDETPQHAITKQVGEIASVLSDAIKAVTWLEACDTGEGDTAETLLELIPSFEAAIKQLEKSCNELLKGST